MRTVFKQGIFIAISQWMHRHRLMPSHIALSRAVWYVNRMNIIRIKTKDHVKQVELDTSETASAIWDALPLEATVNRWGDEIYFTVPVQVELASDARADVVVGDVAYWPPGQAFCIFWGPTPASTDSEPRAASPVNVFGKVLDGPEDFGNVQDGDAIRIEQAEA
jgi:hypothetical protein